MFVVGLCVFKFLANAGSGTVKAQVTKPKIQISSGQTGPAIKLEMEDSMKRKREDDDYDVP